MFMFDVRFRHTTYYLVIIILLSIIMKLPLTGDRWTGAPNSAPGADGEIPRALHGSDEYGEPISVPTALPLPQQTQTRAGGHLGHGG